MRIIPTHDTCHETIYGQRLFAANGNGAKTLSRTCGPDADNRLPLPSGPGHGGGRPPLRLAHRAVAGGRPLQVACHAHQRRGGTLLHGDGHERLGKIREMGGDRALHHAQPAVPLDAPGAAHGIRHPQAAVAPHRPRHIRRVQRQAANARIQRPQPHAPLPRGGGVHHRRPRRLARTPHPYPPGRLRNQDAAHLAAGQAPGGGRPCRFPRLRGTAGRSGGRVHLHLRRPHGCPAPPPRLLRRAGLPPVRPRAGRILRRGLHRGRNQGRIQQGIWRTCTDGGRNGPVQVGHARSLRRNGLGKRLDAASSTGSTGRASWPRPSCTT